MAATRTLGYKWNLRALMAERGMFATTDLGPHLAERGIVLSDTQVYRLVVQKPERLNLHILVCICESWLLPRRSHRARRRSSPGQEGRRRRRARREASGEGTRPTRARILPEDG